MSELVISTSGLRKVYRDRGRKIVAVNGLDLAVPKGGVHGFLGPNGSGKTTTLRMLLGLATATGGEISLFGERVPRQLHRVLPRIGAVVEEPRFVPTFSGRKNLQLLARAAGIAKQRVDEVLVEVGLSRREKERYQGYSLGMKQRLALAATLLKRPELLILDEPTNGLDPAGIRDIRDLVRRLGASGATVLLSSHILAEVQQVCASVTIVGEGRVLATGPVDELLGDRVSRTRIGVADPHAAVQILASAGHDVRREGDHLVIEGHEHPEELTRVLADQGHYVHELTSIQPSLEAVYLKLTGSRRVPAPEPRDEAE